MRAAVELAGFSPSESDELRSAISKKKKDVIPKYQAKFIDGAVTNNIPRATAEMIFADWEEFAHYGFNKSHAADYGYIAVQTGFLKLHYPLEYMTALLTVSMHEIEKVALYANDARQMGVDILPPDVNACEWEFSIEAGENRAAIRFGMGAIKNVGANSADAIVKARGKGGPFKDLNDFSARVDLRLVGKRALECLIKVGALDRFGSRAAMLELLDQIVAVSSSHFRAAEAGQLSFFGAATGVHDSIHLPFVPDADRRELLNWERELMGMYMSEHPLVPYMKDIRRIVTHFAATLGEAQHEEKTRVAGMVIGIRPHQTKTGRMMAWVTLEDLTGTIELVLFPRIWEKNQFALEIGGIIVAEGKVDAKSTPSKILVDNLRTQVKLTDPAQIPLQPVAEKPIERVVKKEAAPAAPVKKVSSSETEAIGAPPPPENPPEWDTYLPAARSAAEADDLGLDAAEVAQEKMPPAPLQPVTATKAQVEVVQPLGAQEETSTVTIRAVDLAKEKPAADSTKQPGPGLAGVTAGEDYGSQMIIVILRPSNDPERDIRRITRLHGTFISYPGNDRFAFHVYEEGRGHLVEFPNDSTRICAELMKKIKDAVGDENIRVEPITYQ